MLPRHWSEAGRLDLALTAAVRAAEASAVVAPDEAAAHYARAVELDARVPSADDPAGSVPDRALRPSRAHLLERLAEQRGAAGDGAAATESARAALELVAGTGPGNRPPDPARAARLHRLVAVHGEGVLADAEVLVSFEAAVAAAEELGPSPELAAALAAQARHELVLDHNARAAPLSRRAREIAVSVGAEPEEAFAAATLGASLCYLGSFDEGLETLAYAVPALEAAHRPYDAARALLTLVWAQFHGGDPQTGRASAERASAALLEGGGPRDVAVRLTAAALEMAVSSGQWDDLDGSLAEQDPGGAADPGAAVSSVEVALLRSVRAELDLRRGLPERAEAGYGSVLAHWDGLGLRAYDAGSLARLAEIAAARGDVGAARAFIDEGLAAVEEADTWVAVLGYARAGLAVEAAAARAGRPVDEARTAGSRPSSRSGRRGLPRGRWPPPSWPRPAPSSPGSPTARTPTRGRRPSAPGRRWASRGGGRPRCSAAPRPSSRGAVPGTTRRSSSRTSSRLPSSWGRRVCGSRPVTSSAGPAWPSRRPPRVQPEDVRIPSMVRPSST